MVFGFSFYRAGQFHVIPATHQKTARLCLFSSKSKFNRNRHVLSFFVIFFFYYYFPAGSVWRQRVGRHAGHTYGPIPTERLDCLYTVEPRDGVSFASVSDGYVVYRVMHQFIWQTKRAAQQPPASECATLPSSLAGYSFPFSVYLPSLEACKSYIIQSLACSWWYFRSLHVLHTPVTRALMVIWERRGSSLSIFLKLLSRQWVSRRGRNVLERQILVKKSLLGVMWRKVYQIAYFITGAFSYHWKWIEGWEYPSRCATSRSYSTASFWPWEAALCAIRFPLPWSGAKAPAYGLFIWRSKVPSEIPSKLQNTFLRKLYVMQADDTQAGELWRIHSRSCSEALLRSIVLSPVGFSRVQHFLPQHI